MTNVKQNTKQALLQHKYLNGWGLFWLISLIICVEVAIPFSRIDTSNPSHISDMIAVSVRLAVPWLYIAFAASSAAYLFKNSLSKWILRNRRIFGLCFAMGMAWQLLFILWLTIGFFEYYMEEAYSYYDLSEQIPGYIILIAMTITSFRHGRRLLSTKQWKILHKGGIYFLWYVVWSTYWFELYYYTQDTRPLDYVLYWMGIAVWLLRLVSWSKKHQNNHKQIVVLLLACLGLYLITFGGPWSQWALAFTPDTTFGGWVELFIPLVPMAPFFAAALMAVRSKKLKLE